MHRLACPLLITLLSSPALAAAGVVRADHLVSAAQARLQERAAGIAADWEFLPATAVVDSTVAQEGAVEIEAGAIDGQWPRSRVGVPVSIRVDGVTVQTRMLWFTVHAWHDGRVHAHDLAAGTPSEDVQTIPARVDIAAHGALSAIEGDGVLPGGQRLLRSVRAGQPVLAADFSPMPLVARNTQVVLRVRQGGIELNTAATARTDAGLGDRVSVLPSSATQWIDARVTGRNEVAIE